MRAPPSSSSSSVAHDYTIIDSCEEGERVALQPLVSRSKSCPRYGTYNYLRRICPRSPERRSLTNNPHPDLFLRPSPILSSQRPSTRLGHKFILLSLQAMNSRPFLLLE